MLDESIIKSLETLPDQDLVQRLKAADNDAWEYIYLKVVCAVLGGSTKNGYSYRQILKDKFIEAEDVWGDLFGEMIIKGKISNFGFRCPLIYWMRFYVVDIIMDYCKKYPSTLSDEGLEFLLFYEDNSVETKEVLEKSFTKLWSENPMKAYVFLLKMQGCFSSDEIRDCLGVSNSNNIDKIYSRARTDMQNLIENFSGGQR